MRKAEIENKVFEVVKGRTDCRGFWKDEAGKVYKDYIKLYAPQGPLDLENKINDLFFKGEKAVFVRGVDLAFVIYPDNKQDVLRENHFYIKERGTLRASWVKKLLADFGGFTVYKEKDYFLFETWSK